MKNTVTKAAIQLKIFSKKFTSDPMTLWQLKDYVKDHEPVLKLYEASIIYYMGNYDCIASQMSLEDWKDLYEEDIKDNDQDIV